MSFVTIEPTSEHSVKRDVRAYKFGKAIKGDAVLMRVFNDEFLTPDEADAMAERIKEYAQWLRTASPSELTEGLVSFI